MHRQLTIALLEATLTLATWSVTSALIDISARRKMLLRQCHVLLALIRTEKDKLIAQTALLEATACTAKELIVHQTNTIQK
jgi:hypothetical protein